MTRRQQTNNTPVSPLLFPVLKAIHFISLYLFLGGPAFWFLIWHPTVGTMMPTEGRTVQRNITFGLILGTSLFALSGFVDVLRAANELIDISDPEMLTFFLSATRFGRLTLIKIALAVAAALSWQFATRNSSRLAAVVATAMSGGLLVVTSLLSHATGKGTFAIASDVIHLMTSIAWAGGLLFLATVPWRAIGAGEATVATTVAALVDRFTNVALIAVPLVAATGAFASYLHVYTPLALQKTSYGLTLVVKIALFLMVMLIAAVNLLVISPGLRQANNKQKQVPFGTRIARVASYVRTEVVVLIALVVAAGVLTTLPPADTFNEIAQDVWELEMGDHFVSVEMSAGSEPGEIHVDIHLTDADGVPAPEHTRVVVDLDMLAHSMGLRPLEAEFMGPGHYRVKPLVSMGGDWEAIIQASFPDGRDATTSFEFKAVQGARSVGQTRRFDIRAVFYDFKVDQQARAMAGAPRFDIQGFIQDFFFHPEERPVRFISGALWLIAAIYVLAASRLRRLPSWTAPIGMVVLGLGGYFLFTAMLVDAYPTTYAKNPVPFVSGSVDAGKELYAAHCSQCHGPKGYGDGELAPFLDPPAEDLRARHVDVHSDGELFWWISHGIPGSEMPGVESITTEEERWQIVQFVRSIQRGFPESDRE